MHGNQLAEKLEAILASGATYKTVAEAAGCDASTIYRIRSGAIVNPSYAIGKVIEQIFDEIPEGSHEVKRTA